MKRSFYRHFIFLLVSGLLLMQSGFLAAQSISVVVHPDLKIEQLSKDEVKSIFLSEGNAKYKKIIVFDRSDFGLKGIFYRHIAGMSMNRLRAYWAKKVFTGRGRPPKTVALPDHMELMERTVNLMTYVYSNQVPEGFDVVYQFEVAE